MDALLLSPRLSSGGRWKAGRHRARSWVSVARSDKRSVVRLHLCNATADRFFSWEASFVSECDIFFRTIFTRRIASYFNTYFPPPYLYRDSSDFRNSKFVNHLQELNIVDITCWCTGNRHVRSYLGGTFELMGPLSPLFRPIVVSFNRGENGSNISVLNHRINNVLLSFSF